MIRIVIGVVVAVLVPSANGAEFEIESSLKQGDPKGDRAAGTLKMVAAPMMRTKSGESASLLVGGRVMIGGQLVPVGREVKVTATTADNGAIKVRAELRIHSSVGAEGARQVVTTRELAEAIVQSGGAVRVAIGSDPKNRQWVDVVVRKVE